jgi:hypothetical protein
MKLPRRASLEWLDIELKGGCRVSLYKGITVEAVETLVDFMSEFTKQHSQLSNLGLTQFGEPMVKSRA